MRITGRENIRPQALLNGYDQARLRQKFDEIIAFADIGDFIDAPLQHYSTGMRARLGFAIAAHSAPDILLIDEVLAVGDLAFQNKCLRFIEGFRERGGTVVFVGHSTHQMQAACDRGIILSTGTIGFDGSMVDALDRYMAPEFSDVEPSPAPTARVGAATARSPEPAASSAAFQVDLVSLTDEGDALPAIALDLQLSEAIADVRFVVAIVSQSDGASVAAAVTEPLTLPPGAQRIRVRLTRVPLLPGAYLVRLAALGGANIYPLWARGWEDAPFPVQIAGEATATGNLFESVGFRVRLDASVERLEREQ